MESFNEDEINDLQTTIQELIENYLDINLIHMSNPYFHENMVDSITDLVYKDLVYADIYEEQEETTDEYLDLHDFVEENINNYFTFHRVPMRSNSITIEENYIDPDRIEKIKEKIDHLQEIEQPEQKSREWYVYRYNLITASNLWKVFGTESQVNSLIYEKCKPFEEVNFEFSLSSGPLYWGVKYEPVTIMIYEDMFRTQIGEFGCLPHPKHSFIGASPDGINIDPLNLRYGRMLEIKNIYNREITCIPKQEYWIQTQLQMEVCDLDECDFVETRIKEFETKEHFLSSTEHEYKGAILQFLPKFKPCDMSKNEQVLANNKITYVYAPLNLLSNDLDAYIDKEIEKHDQFILTKIDYYYLDEFSCVLIKRNRDWFDTCLPKIQNTWDIIVKERVDGYEHRASKKRRNSADEKGGCMIQMDEKEWG